MNGYNNYTYWIAVAHLPRWTIDRTNRFIIAVVHDKKLTWSDFFELDRTGWKELFDFTEKELDDLTFVKDDMPRLAFIAEQLQNEGFHIIPVNSPDYPVVLKENLNIKSTPPVLYIKGRLGLLQEDAVAIVGSRKAGDAALQFTDHVAKKCVKEFKVVVSGFAKGVDKQALDSTLEVNGKSIIVLPQGILTFQSGFKKYYEPIVNGNVLVLSTFFPKAGWDVGLAMARNAYIYGLAKEIYVAESDSKGGTWEGALDGLKKGRNIFVREPAPGENNANKKLVTLGAAMVDKYGNSIGSELISTSLAVTTEVEEADNSVDIENVQKEILQLLKKGEYTAKQIVIALKLTVDSKALLPFLKENPNVKVIKGAPVKYTHTAKESPTLF